VRITASSFASNTASGSLSSLGGGICVSQSGPDIFITTTAFDNNQASVNVTPTSAGLLVASGGGLHVDSARALTVRNANFTANRANSSSLRTGGRAPG
jgi:hypothetical protein